MGREFPGWEVVHFALRGRYDLGQDVVQLSFVARQVLG